MTITRCQFCHMPQSAKPRKTRTATACADPATCWEWDHPCYARRGPRGRRSVQLMGYAPATIAGRVVPNIVLQAVAA